MHQIRGAQKKETEGNIVEMVKEGCWGHPDIKKRKA